MHTTRLISERSFERLAAGLGPCELEQGEVVRLSPGGMPHSRCTATIAFLLEKWARAGKRGRVFTNEAGLITERDPDSVRGVDVAYYSYGRLPRSELPEGFTDVPPTLAVEVVGKGQGWRKLLEKAGEYLRIGVDRVWIVDPGKRRMCVLQGDEPPRVLGGRQTLADADALPGFRCRVAELFV